MSCFVPTVFAEVEKLTVRVLVCSPEELSPVQRFREPVCQEFQSGFQSDSQPFLADHQAVLMGPLARFRRRQNQLPQG